MSTPHTVGHSNGWLCATLGPEYENTKDVLKLSAATCCEFVIDRGERLEQLTRPTADPAISLELASLHLPDLRDVDTLPENSRNYLGDEIRLLKKRFDLKTASLHPDLASLEIAEWLKQLDLPFGIENMDRNKMSYRSNEEVSHALNTWRVPLVLDLQHAFENSVDAGGDGIDLSVTLAKSASKAFGITHLHVSGEIASRSGAQIESHASLLWATNTRTILEAVRAVLRTMDGPARIILEGNYLPTNPPGGSIDRADRSKREELLAKAAENMRKERELVLEAITESR